MIKRFKINGYRKFDELELNNLGRVNFILGDNNIGKTTILESIFNFCTGKYMPNIFYNSIIRGNEELLSKVYGVAEACLSAVNKKNCFPLKFSYEADVDDNRKKFTHIFSPGPIMADLNAELGQEIKKNRSYQYIPYNSPTGNSILKGLEKFILDWRIEESEDDVVATRLAVANGFFQSGYLINGPVYADCGFYDITAQRKLKENIRIYSKLKQTNMLDDFVNRMSTVYDNIFSIEYIPYLDGMESCVSIKNKNNEYLPLYTFGDGIQRWYTILGSMLLYQDAYICIDEIDTAFDYKVNEVFSKTLLEYAERYNVQLFITTHNIEWMDSLLDSCKELPEIENVRIITLKNIKNECKIRIINGIEAFNVREKYNMELR